MHLNSIFVDPFKEAIIIVTITTGDFQTPSDPPLYNIIVTADICEVSGVSPSSILDSNGTPNSAASMHQVVMHYKRDDDYRRLVMLCIPL